jgi:hypothetical protein
MKAGRQFTVDLLFISAILTLSSIILFASRNFFSFPLPLFEEIFFSATSAIVLALGFSILHKKKSGAAKIWTNFAYLSFIGFLVSLLVLSNSLLNIDRSRSFYVLSWVDQEKVSSIDGVIEESISSTEANDLNSLEMRIMEHEERGLIKNENGKYYLTFGGGVMLSLSNFLAQIFNLENWQKNKN